MSDECSEPSRLEDLQFMLGADAGSLALAMEHLTDAIAQIAQHKVYCRLEKGPRAGQPPLDVIAITSTLARAKTLMQEVLLRLKEQSA